MYIEKESYCKELIHTVVEAEKLQDLWAACWRPRRVHVVAPAWVLSPVWEPGRPIASSSLKAERLDTQEELVSVKLDVLAQDRQADGIPSYSREGQPFCSNQAFTWSGAAHPRWGSNVFYSVHRFQCSSLHGDVKNLVGPDTWSLHGPVMLIHKINHHRGLKQ